MEQTLQTGKDTLQALSQLDDQLGMCRNQAACADLMAEDLIEYFETLEDPSEDNKATALLYFQENHTRAQILQDYTHKALAQVAAVEEQLRQLFHALRQEEK